MAQIADIVITDGQAVPVAHTYNPIEQGSETVYREAISNLALVGQGRIRLANKSAAAASLQRVKMQLELPALETATGQNAQGYTAAPKVAYTNTVLVEFILPARGTPAQRKDLRVQLQNLLANAQVVDLIDNLAQPY